MSIKRSSFLEPKDIHKAILQNSDFTSVFNQMPNMALVVNQKRQIVFGNQQLLNELGLDNIEDSLSLKPGELLKCIYAVSERGCGGSEECRYCDALSALRESQSKKCTITKDARVTVRPASKEISLDIKVTAAPLSIDNLSMTMVFFNDISDQKRREYLEEVFLHDTRNTLSALTMQGELLDLNGLPQDLEQDISSMKKYLGMLVDDIDGHQLLINAEKGVLQSHLTVIAVHELVGQCIETVSKAAQAASVNIMINLDDVSESLVTDPRLARRILVNALKNAIEASPQSSEITLKVSGDKNCKFSINNPGVLDGSAQKQIFHRSFSTKGLGRGLGTYSMRLLLENYLEGKVSFTSSKEHGTTFDIMFPNLLSKLSNYPSGTSVV